MFLFGLPISEFQEFLRKKVSCLRCCFCSQMIESYIWINLLIDYDILPMTSYRQFLHKTTRNYEFHQNKSNFIKTDQQIFLINFYFVLFESLHILSLNYWLNASISFCLRMRCYFRGFCVFETVRNEFIKCVVFFFFI